MLVTSSVKLKHMSIFLQKRMRQTKARELILIIKTWQQPEEVHFFQTVAWGNIYTTLTWHFIRDSNEHTVETILLQHYQWDKEFYAYWAKESAWRAATTGKWAAETEERNQLTMRCQGTLQYRKLTKHFPAKCWSCYTDTSACLNRIRKNKQWSRTLTQVSSISSDCI